MTLSEKLKIDSEMVCRAMVFFVDGNFYAAYERSAFLATRLLPPLKVTCRFRKAVEQAVAQVGFPASSLPKFATSLRLEQQEGMLLLLLPDDISFKKEEFKVWKLSLPIAQQGDGPHPSAKSQGAIIESILAYPLESRTPIEAMLFLADLKKRLQSCIA